MTNTSILFCNSLFCLISYHMPWSASNRDNASVYRGSFIYLTLFFLVKVNITLFIFLTHKQLGVTSTHMDLGTLLSARICFGESAARRNSYPIKPDILEICCHLPAFSLALYDLPILGYLLRAHSYCFSWGLFPRWLYCSSPLLFLLNYCSRTLAFSK